MQKKSFRFLLSFVLVLTTVTTGILPISVTAASFTDVPDGAYYSESVEWAVDKGITKGTSDTTFAPDDGCTRAQVVTFLWRAAGQPDANIISDFLDVATDAYYSTAVSWAVENNITQGVGNDCFEPEATCTRGQIVTFLWRYKGEPDASTDSGFSDVLSSKYYAAPVTWAVQNAITQGVSNNRFAPDDTCTRGQIVTFLYRSRDLLSDQTVKSDLKGYDSSHCQLLDIIPVEESTDVQTEAEAHSTMEDLGLDICPITYQFGMDGEYVGEVEAEVNSSDKHPVYQTLFLSKNEELWNVYLINGNVIAYPVSFNLKSNLDAELIVSTSEMITCYSGETNEFYETIPYSSDAITVVVDTIDAEVLNRLTIEELCSMSGATVPFLTEDEMELMELDSDRSEVIDDSSTVSVMGDTGTEDPFIVVSLGDSFSSGEGIPEFYGQSSSLTDKVYNPDWLAHRSKYSWASRLEFEGVAGTLGEYRVDYSNGKTSNADVQWYFAASSGAITDHISLEKQKKGKGKQNKPYYKYTEADGMNQALLGLKLIPHIENEENYLPNQLDVFDIVNNNNGYGKIDCVTLTIGGNDLGFVKVIETAAIESSYLMRFAAEYTDLDTWGEDLTVDDYDTLLNYMLDKRIEDLDQYLKKIQDVYKGIREKAGSQAVILVAGYPELLEKNGAGTAISKDEATLINSAVRLFNEGLDEMITNECGDIGNIYFVGVIDEFNTGSGHQAYSKKEAWINEIIPGTKSEDLKDFPHSLVSSYSIHPNKDGAKAYARCVNEKIKICSGTITGKVVDSHTGEPIRHNGSFIVNVRNKDGNVEKMNWGTDAGGNFAFVISDNEKGPYSIEISNIWNGYTNELDTVVIDNITLDPIRPTNIGTIELYKNGADDGSDPVDNPHVKDGTITDSWDQIIASCNDGTYKNKYHIGDTKTLDLGSEGNVEMQIAAFDADELADGSGKAAITWISKQLLKSTHKMNPPLMRDQEDPSLYMIGTGNIGGWEDSEMRSWLKEYVRPLIPSTVQNAIKPVTKYSFTYDALLYGYNTVTVEDVWIPSSREVLSGFSDQSIPETKGPAYTELFASRKDVIKQIIGESNASWWWLRSAGYSINGSNVYFREISEGVDSMSGFPTSSAAGGVALGFCI